MLDAFASRSSGRLIKSPTPRQQAARRWLFVLCGVLALALASGMVGAIADHHTEALGKPQTGPFSYFPSE